MSFGGLYYPAYTPGFGSRPRLQTTHPFRHLVAAGSNINNNKWSGANGDSGYGLETPEYDYHSGPSVHVPSGGSYSYHATAGTGYGPPAPPTGHPKAKPAASQASTGAKNGVFGNTGKQGSSVMSALTLLSFLFFINLLQSCIKDHMDAINPTVAVMTTNVIRNRFNKMGEMNSREQSSFHTSNAANIVVQPNDMLQAGAVQYPSVANTARPSVSLQSTYINNPVSFNRPIEQPIPQSPSPYMSNNSPEPEVPINYAKPQHDPHKPDTSDHLPEGQHTPLYDNHTSPAKHPPYGLTPIEQHYNFHHTEYNAQPQPRPSLAGPQFTSSQNPFYEHQHPVSARPYNSDYGSQYSGFHTDYDFRQNYEVKAQSESPTLSQSSTSNSGPPWSTNSQTSSIVSGPYRRASVIAVAPKTKWITVPAKIIDRTNFATEAENMDGQFEHHDDRDVFRSRFI